ncbi:NAD(P)/FAD-dependent oxidoreductase, partial [bacterium]|nr:NAD(P)/FAD-dependent oxidoreductase [bacterium]
GTLATIGRSAGIAHLGRLRLSGFLAWLAWLLVHLLFLIGLRNRVSVFISWAYSYFTYKLGARIIVSWPESSPCPDLTARSSAK